MGVGRLFSRGGQNFPKGGGQGPHIYSPVDAHEHNQSVNLRSTSYWPYSVKDVLKNTFYEAFRSG